MAEGSKGLNTAATVLSVVLALLFLATGAMKLAGVEQVATDFGRFGYPLAFAYVIGLVEIGGGLLLFAPAVAAYAAGVLILVMLGAAFTHLMVGDPTSNVLIPLVIAVLLGAVAWLRRPGTV
jgi:uncharacterized membrane protein YphA (DoxX/SURF4 family)